MKSFWVRLARELSQEESIYFLAGRTAAVLWVVFVLATPALGDNLIFDNADLPLSTTFRNSPPLGVGAYIQIGANNVTISQIGINAAPGQNGQLKFLIFADTAGASTAGPLLFSDTVNVTASGTLSYILSDPLSFTLQAGQYYDIGALFNGTSINYSYDLTPDTQNGITSIKQNANFDNFASPIMLSHAFADINIRLYSIPEPSGLMLSSMGVGTLAWRRWKRGRQTRA